MLGWVKARATAAADFALEMGPAHPAQLRFDYDEVTLALTRARNPTLAPILTLTRFDYDEVTLALTRARNPTLTSIRTLP